MSEQLPEPVEELIRAAVRLAPWSVKYKVRSAMRGQLPAVRAHYFAEFEEKMLSDAVVGEVEVRLGAMPVATGIPGKFPGRVRRTIAAALDQLEEPPRV